MADPGTPQWDTPKVPTMNHCIKVIFWVAFVTLRA